MTPNFWTSGIWPSGIWPGLFWPAPAITTPPVPKTTTHITARTFPFKRNFPSLYDANGNAPDVDFACLMVEAEWSGIFSFFTNLDQQTMVNRQAILESYLVGWWLGDLYPSKMRGVQGDGGMPLSSKSIGGVSISRRDIEIDPALAPLLSNAFGVKAATMILSRVERFSIIPGAPTLPIPVTTWQELASVLSAGVEIPAP